MQQVSFEYMIEVEIGEGVFQELELQITGTVHPAELGSKDPDGFQVEPDSGPYFEVSKIFDQYGNEHFQNDMPDHWDEIERIAIENVNDFSFADYDEVYF